jgi:hypothetical protein
MRGGEKVEDEEEKEDEEELGKCPEGLPIGN